jgi:hypothetical protein
VPSSRYAGAVSSEVAPVLMSRSRLVRLAQYNRGVLNVVVAKNSVRSENTGVLIIREIMVATTMSSLSSPRFLRPPGRKHKAISRFRVS